MSIDGILDLRSSVGRQVAKVLDRLRRESDAVLHSGQIIAIFPRAVNASIPWRSSVAGLPSGVCYYSVASPNGSRELDKVVVLNPE